MYRLGILASHPIQYQTPLFRELAARTNLHVYFAHRPTEAEQGEGYGVPFNWDIDLLSGYEHSFLHNRASHPSVSRFYGCDTPEIGDLIANGSHQYFLVSGWYLKCYWQAISACRRRGVPLIVRGDSRLGKPTWIKQSIKEFSHRIMLRKFDACLAVGKHSRSYFLHYGVPEHRIFFSPHCVDNDRFRNSASSAKTNRQRVRESLGCDTECILLLYVGRLIPLKRLKDLMRAAHILEKRGLQVVPLISGTGPLEDELRSLARTLGLRAHFAGFVNQSQLAPYLTAADLLVLPSAQETWGLVVNEAMASGLPAVVSDAVGCAPDLIEDGLTGAIYPVGNAEALADAIERMVPKLGTVEIDRTLRDKMQAYSVEAAVAGIMTCLEFLRAK